MKSSLFFNLHLSSVLIGFVFLTSGCEGCKQPTIKLPKQDLTKPTFKWVIQVKNNKGDSYETIKSGETLTLARDYVYDVFFIVYDNEGGIKSISVSGGGLTACPKSPKANIASVSCNDAATFSPDINGNVITSSFRLCKFDVTCKGLPGSIFSPVLTGPGGTIFLTGEGENYFGGIIKSTLTIVSTPGIN